MTLSGMKEKQVSLSDKTRRMVSNNRQSYVADASRNDKSGGQELCHRLSNNFLDAINLINNKNEVTCNFLNDDNKQICNIANYRYAPAKTSKPQQLFANKNKYFEPIVSSSPKGNSNLTRKDNSNFILKENSLVAGGIQEKKCKKNNQANQGKSTGSRNSPTWNRDCTLSPIFTYYAGAKFSSPPSPTEVPKPPVTWLKPASGSCTCPCSNPCSKCSSVPRNTISTALLHVPA